MNVRSIRLAARAALAALALVGVSGCSASGPGQTVPGPPRSLVERTGPRPGVITQQRHAPVTPPGAGGAPAGN